MALRQTLARTLRQLMTAALRRGGATGAVEFDADGFELHIGEGRFFLGNAYADYAKAPYLGRAEVVKRYALAAAGVGGPTELPSDFEQARGSLLPRIRLASYGPYMRLLGQSRGVELPHFLCEPFGEALSVELIFDTLNSVMSVDPEQLIKWKVSPDEAMQVARDNLWKLSNKPMNRLASGLYVSSWDDTHDASRLYLHDLIWQLPVKGRHVAAIPSRSALLVCGSEDTDALVQMAELVKKVLQEDTRTLAGHLFILEGSAWVPYLPPEGHPARNPLAYCRIIERGQDYGEQAQLLQQIHEKSGQDIHVGSYSIFENKETGETLSYCVWGEGVLSLLPKTDMVGFVTAEPGRNGKSVLGMAP